MCEWGSSIRKFSGITAILQVLYYKLQILQVLLPICYKNLNHPTCVNLNLSNTPRSFPSTSVIETGPLDFHLMTLPFMTKSFTKFKAQLINHSSYKNFSNDAFRECLLEKLSKEVFVNKNYELQRLSQQTRQRRINIKTTLIVNVHQRCFNVDIWLKMKVEPTYIYRRCFNVDKTTLIELRRFNVDEPTLFQR